jgi:hypothetical protein
VDNSGNNTTEGYTNNANLITGPVGDVFDIDFVKNISNSNKYKENPLSNAQALLGKLASGIVLPQGQGQKHVVSQNDKISGLGTSYTHPYIIDWIKDGNTFNLSNVTPSISEKENLDGMAHFMKGNIGLFLSGSMGITGSAKITGVSADGAVFRQIPDATGSKAHNNLYKATSNINLTLN